MIYLIRHGESIANKKMIVGMDDPLTENGKKELLNVHVPWVKKVYSSNLQRAKETAKILYPNHNIKVFEEFNEICFGEYEGKTIDDTFIKVFDNNTWDAHFLWGGDDFDERVDAAVRKMKELNDESIAIISHDTLMRAILSKLKYGTIRKMTGIKRIGNGEIICMGEKL